MYGSIGDCRARTRLCNPYSRVHRAAVPVIGEYRADDEPGDRAAPPAVAIEHRMECTFGGEEQGDSLRIGWNK